MSSKRVLTYIIGSNGAGKSTLARNILGADITHAEIKGLGYCAKSLNNAQSRTRPEIVALGRYTSACGGVDTIKPLSNAYRLGERVADLFPDSNMFMEGVIMSGLFSTPLKFLLNMKYQHGFDVEICFLYASARESLNRVFGRNGGTAIKQGGVLDKLKETMQNYKKFLELGEFRCIAIDTTKINSDQVFAEFRHWSGLYERE